MATDGSPRNRKHAAPVPAGAGDVLELPQLFEEDSTLARLLQGIASMSGQECFKPLTKSLAELLSVKYAVIAEFVESTRSAKALAFWNGSEFLEHQEWPLAGTPCEQVIAGDHVLCLDGLAAKYPEDKPLAEMNARSYLGVPLLSPDRKVLGHLFVMDSRPMVDSARNLALFQVFAARAASELGRVRLERSLAESEERFRDLFDEAPIAYVHEELDTRFIRANRAALRAFEIEANDVTGTYGKSFVVDNPDNQRRLQEAFESVGRGTDTSGVILELRRKKSGKPLWIQWWSKPSPDGSFTRTMFIDITDKVLMQREQERLRAQNQQLTEDIKAVQNFGDIVGRSPSLMVVLKNVDRVAPTDSTVLIQGETGSGKELIARAIHERSQRASGPFVKVNCAALPAGLVESEFFGHEKGAFTGAVGTRKGRFELADSGTIFLDEVGEVSPDVQVKLLRVLQENEFERVGGSETIRVNVRVIAATNRDLAADVKQKNFRADLFYRLSVFPISVPPLRERAADIPLLASYFVGQISAAMGKPIEEIDAPTLNRLCAYSWPGNIRELRNMIERAIILADSTVLRIADRDFAASTPTSDQPVMTLSDMEKAHIERALAQTKRVIGGPNGAAKLLGVPASTLRSAMERLGIAKSTD
ncbi:MAG: sigma 54-interacting transcriptional regulator [Phycisphaerales bacterium]